MEQHYRTHGPSPWSGGRRRATESRPREKNAAPGLDPVRPEELEQAGAGAFELPIRRRDIALIPSRKSAEPGRMAGVAPAAGE
jgi:hypothetical protein